MRFTKYNFNLYGLVIETVENLCFVCPHYNVGNTSGQCKQVRVRDNACTYVLNFSFLVTSISRSLSASPEDKTASILKMNLTLGPIRADSMQIPSRFQSFDPR